jgi:hypothetical protein
MNKDEFYNGDDSCFIKVQYMEAANSFRLIIRNEYLIRSEGMTNENAIMIGNIARGLLELCYSNPKRVHDIGESAIYKDMVYSSANDLNDAQKKIWLGNVENDTIN